MTSLIGSKSDWRLRKPSMPTRPSLGLAWIGPVALLTATFVGWFAFEDAVGDEDNVAFALFIGSVSILFMAWSNLLSTRVRFLEPFFGGLDRMYRWHRWFGALSVATMWYHIQTIDDVKGIAGASKSVADTAEDLAGTAETMLYILIVVSLVRWIPYRWWRQSHKLLIAPYALSAWHFHTATKPYANSDPWGRWFQGLMLLGVASWVYRVLWRDGVRRGLRYRIENVSDSGPITTIEMTPVGRPIRHRAGQFVFLRIGKGTVSEPHPFTIASRPGEPVLRVHIKRLGDWSDQLSDRVRVGEQVKVEGPHGRLPVWPRADDPERPIVWIAGGVGITPFIGAAQRRPGGHAIPHLFYAVRSREEAAGLDVLRAAHENGKIHLHLHVSSEGGRLCGDDVTSVFPAGSLTGSHVVMCGPDSMVTDMTNTVRSLGARHVHVEGFDIRTGVGPDLSVEVEGLWGKYKHRKTSASVLVPD